MAGGLVALLDDIAAIAKIAAASVDDVAAAAGRAGTKSLGVVIDDAAVTPRYVTGAKAARELPIIKKIAIGSIRNKLLFILPAIMLLSQFAPWTLTPILMLGGSYLCFEGAEKVYEVITGHHKEKADVPAVEQGPEQEDKMVRGAITTDFILSAEIMVIALKEVIEEPLLARAIILAVVAVIITIGVYGVVALIVKMDDVGLRLAERGSATRQRLGRGLVAGMPKLLAWLTVIGTAAMLWVGGHILLAGADELGWHGPYGIVHDLEHAVDGVAGIGGVLAWFVNTLSSAVVGLVWGTILVFVIERLPFPRKEPAGAADSHA